MPSRRSAGAVMTRLSRSSRRGAAAVAGAATAVLLVLGPAAGPAASADPPSLVVDDGSARTTVRLTDLVPGVPQHEVVTVTARSAAEVHLAATVAPAPPAALDVTVELCPEPWQDDSCPAGALPVPVDGTSVDAGTLDGGAQWSLRLTAALTSSAPNDTQDQRWTIDVVLTTARGSAALGGPADLGATGVPSGLLGVGAAAAVLLVAGVTLVRAARRTGPRHDA